MVTLHEQMVHLVEQLQLPLLEVSLVIAKYTRLLSETLAEFAAENKERLPELLLNPWPLDEQEGVESNNHGMELEKIMQIIDQQRMDIFDTLIRSVVNTEQMPLADALMVLREWEQTVRLQLSKSTGPGQLFSPLDLGSNY